MAFTETALTELSQLLPTIEKLDNKLEKLIKKIDDHLPANKTLKPTKISTYKGDNAIALFYVLFKFVKSQMPILPEKMCIARLEKFNRKIFNSVLQQHNMFIADHQK